MQDRDEQRNESIEFVRGERQKGMPTMFRAEGERTMSDELKPCAHCGESAELCCPSGLSWWVRCSNTQCGMATKIAYSPEPVVAAWNRRADAALAKREAVAEIDADADLDGYAHQYAEGWNDCRRAMLAASQQAAKNNDGGADRE